MLVSLLIWHPVSVFNLKRPTICRAPAAKCAQTCHHGAMATSSILTTSTPPCWIYRISNLRSCKAAQGNWQIGSSFLVCKGFGGMPQEVSHGLRTPPPQLRSLSGNILGAISCLLCLSTCCLCCWLLPIKAQCIKPQCHSRVCRGLRYLYLSRIWLPLLSNIFWIPQVLIHQKLVHGNLEPPY